MYAAKNGNEEVVKILLEHGANIEANDNEDDNNFKIYILSV